MLEPVHAGRALASDESREALSSMMGDDSGDNISSKNPWYAELTVIYWAWKNRAALGNPDYIGLSHYRRLFTLTRTNKSDADNAPKQYQNRVTQDYVQNHELLEKIIEANDMIIPRPMLLRKLSSFSFYAKNHNIEDITECLSILKQQYPQWGQLADTFIGKNYFHQYNMMVMKWDLFDKYCKFLFGILFEFEKRRDLSKYTGFQQRVVGYLAERLTSLFFSIMTSQHPELKVKELYVNSLVQSIRRPLQPGDLTFRFWIRHPFFFLKPTFWKDIRSWTKA